MRKKYLYYYVMLCAVLLLPSVLGENTHIPLLAVSEDQNGTLQGGVADLFLEIREGTGKVFIDTYPVSKFDTQLSIRFAKDVACKLAEVDCSQYDFLYTIRARSSTVGGPSAGAAVALITYAQLRDARIFNRVAVTGTINSGGLIGSVGGVKEKIEGAKQAGITKVLISPSDTIYRNASQRNESEGIDLIDFGAELGISVIPVSDMEELIFQATGVIVPRGPSTFEVSPEYTAIMRGVADELCTRSDELLSLIEDSGFVLDDTIYVTEPINTTFAHALEVQERGHALVEEGNYYSGASQCFSANMQLSFINLLSGEHDEEYYIERQASLEEAIALLEGNVRAQELTTIPALQTAMIVRQRLEEAKRFLENARAINLTEDDETAQYVMIYNTAATIERLKTTALWARFFELEGEEFQMDARSLTATCNDIITDAKSRIQYAHVYLPGRFAQQATQLDELDAFDDPAYCIAEASIIKAGINAVLSTMSVGSREANELVWRKLEKAAEVLGREIESGRFPILGYSYYEYGRSLAERDASSALLYAEYALELSNLDVYISSQLGGEMVRRVSIPWNEIMVAAVLLTIGFLLGIQASSQQMRNMKRELNRVHASESYSARSRKQPDRVILKKNEPTPLLKNKKQQKRQSKSTRASNRSKSRK